ncbi:MAG: ROK family protein [Phycisphaerae bacterium]|nr:ROK family protein [Phycisphaerae bacterium]
MRVGAGALGQSMHAAATEAGAAGENAEGGGWSSVGLCVPGLVGRGAAGELVVLRSVNAPGLEGVSLGALLRKAGVGGGAEPRVLSDAHAAALDAARELGLTGEEGGGRVLAISIGTGVGACVLDGAERLVVTEGSSGHLGQIDVRQEEAEGSPPVGADGGVGSLEAYVGLRALEWRYGVVGEEAVARVRVEDPPGRALVQAIRIAHAIYRPRHVVLLGGVGIRLGPIIGALRQAVSAGLTDLAREGWTLSCGTSDSHAAAGAARWAMQGGG